MRTLFFKTILFFSFLIGSLAVLLLIMTLAQMLFIDIDSKIYVARIGISFLTLVIVTRTIIECDKQLY